VSAPLVPGEDYRLLVEQAPVLVWRASAAGQRDYFNRRWLAFTGVPFEQQQNDGWLSFVHPDELDGLLRSWRTAFGGQQPFEVVYRLRRHDGVYRWVLDRGGPVDDETGRVLAYVGTCVDITEGVETETALRRIAGRLIGAHEAADMRLARSLYDEVGQELAVVALAIGVLKHATREDLDGIAKEELGRIEQRVVTLIEEVRHLSHDLHPDALRHMGLGAALKTLGVEVERHYDVQVSIETDGDLRSVPDGTALCLFRIAQEALRNAALHGNARRIHLSVERSAESIVLTVEDDGSGFDLAEVRRRGRGVGLVSMEERAAMVGGRLRIDSRPLEGATIHVSVPAVYTVDARTEAGEDQTAAAVRARVPSSIKGQS
jgi:PAS domain S-box-containing protein